MGKKQDVIEAIYKICKKEKNFVFHNDLVKEVSKEYGFGNPFDATKVDNINVLPELLIKEDMAIIHLGDGYHSFFKGIKKIYHPLEQIKD